MRISKMNSLKLGLASVLGILVIVALASASVVFAQMDNNPLNSNTGSLEDIDSYGFEDISSIGTKIDALSVAGVDAQSLRPLNLGVADAEPFNFEFYGDTYDKVVISSNGLLMPTTADDLIAADLDISDSVDLSDTTTRPAYPPRIALQIIEPFWADLYGPFDDNGGVYEALLGEYPNRRYIVQWYRIAPTPDAEENDLRNFQVILFEGSNIIEFHYDRTTSGARDLGVTSGIAGPVAKGRYSQSSGDYETDDNSNTGSLEDVDSYGFEDISSIGTKIDALSVAGVDAQSLRPLNLGIADAEPFNFEFYGDTYNKVFVSSNGLLIPTITDDLIVADLDTSENVDLSDTATRPAYPPQIAPQLIAPFWADLYGPFDDNGGVYEALLGEYPNRRYIVQWYRIAPTPDANVNDLRNFQVILFEGSNIIEFNYGRTTGDARDTATIGVAGSVDELSFRDWR